MIPMICTDCNTLEPAQMSLNTTKCRRCGGRMEFTQQHGYFMAREEIREINREKLRERESIREHHNQTGSVGLGDVTGEPQNNGFYGMPDEGGNAESPYSSGLGGDSDDYDPDVGF